MPISDVSLSLSHCWEKTELSADFKRVVHRRWRFRRKVDVKRFSGGVYYCDSVFSEEFLDRRISDAKQCLADSIWYHKIVYSIQASLLELGTTDVPDIICYGLGKFSDSFISRFQLALLIMLKERFSSKVLIYDPIFDSMEKKYLLSLGFTCLSENEEGKHSMSKISLIYLPHCPKQLMNNLLFSNWGLNLNKCLILGNSFSSIITSNPDNELKMTLKCIYDIYSSVKEVIIENTFSHTNVFNDFSLHIFPLRKLLKHDYTFWNKLEAPKYNDDPEFIKAMNGHQSVNLSSSG